MAILMVNETTPRLEIGLETARPTPCQILWDLLDAWMTLDDARATWDEVEDLYHDIVGFWHAYPDEAEGWYLVWREMRVVA